MRLGTSLLVLTLVSAACKKPPATPVFGKPGMADSNVRGSKANGAGEGGEAGEADSEPSAIDQANEEAKAKRIAEEKLSLALTEEFAAFSKAVDEVDLKPLENAGKVPALIVKSQINLVNIFIENEQEEPEQPKGRCIVFASGDKSFTDADITSQDLVLSPGGKFIYSENMELNSADCQLFFKDRLAERYKTGFFNLHEAFYSLR